jgi:hypothetical protein
LQDPPEVTQILIFGLKTNHLATLPRTGEAETLTGVDVMITIFFVFCQFAAKKFGVFLKNNVIIKI